MATTTAAIAGLTCLQLYSLMRDSNDYMSLRNTFINLSNNLLISDEPFLVNDNKLLVDYINCNMSIKMFELEGGMTINELAVYMKKEYNIVGTMITFFDDTKLNLNLKEG